MEKPTYTAIDYNSYENRVIEERVREYYPQVKALIEMVITKRLRNLQVWYVFFYEKKGRKSNLVVGKETAQYILNCVE